MTQPRTAKTDHAVVSGVSSWSEPPAPPVEIGSNGLPKDAPARPAGEGWKLGRWLDIDNNTYSWIWVRPSPPEEIERAIGQENVDDAGAETSRSTNSARERRQSGLMTTVEAIEYCRVSRSQFFEWLGAGYFKQIKVGRYVRYRTQALDEFLSRFERLAARAPRHKRRMGRLP